MRSMTCCKTLNHRIMPGQSQWVLMTVLDPLETTATIKIEDNRPASPEITAKVLDRIDELARRAGLLPAPKIIDVDSRRRAAE